MPTYAEVLAEIEACKAAGTDPARVEWNDLKAVLTSMLDYATTASQTFTGLQNKGAVAGAVAFNLDLFNDFRISIAANITASFSTPATPTYILIEVTHTGAGTTITGLPGTFEDGFAWATGAGDVTLLVGRYNGANWKWTSSVYS